MNGALLPTQSYASDAGGDRGSTGVALFLEGSSVGAVVSSGLHLWSTTVQGLAPGPGRWTHLGVTWKRPRDPKKWRSGLVQALSADDQGGLALYLDGDRVGRVVRPSSVVPSRPALLKPSEVLLGYHKTAADPKPRLRSGGTFDEVAVWKRQLKQDEAKEIFLGGFGKF